MTLLQHRPATHTTATQAQAGTPGWHEDQEDRADFVAPRHAIDRTIPGTVATMRRGDRFLHGSIHHVVEIEVLDDQPAPSNDATGNPRQSRRVRRHDTGTETTYSFTGDGPCAQALICPEHGGALGMKPGCYTCAPVIA